MSQEIGESREQWGKDVLAKAQDIANNSKSDGRPFYIVFAAKEDKGKPGVFRQAFKTYFERPPLVLGVLVWYVDQTLGVFDFVPELSSPPDVPINELLLSDKAEDASSRVAQQGEKLKVILS